MIFVLSPSSTVLSKGEGDALWSSLPPGALKKKLPWAAGLEITTAFQTVLAISQRKDLEEVHGGIKALSTKHAWPAEPACTGEIASVLQTVGHLELRMKASW